MLWIHETVFMKSSSTKVANKSLFGRRIASEFQYEHVDKLILKKELQGSRKHIKVNSTTLTCEVNGKLNSAWKYFTTHIGLLLWLSGVGNTLLSLKDTLWSSWRRNCHNFVHFHEVEWHTCAILLKRYKKGNFVLNSWSWVAEWRQNVKSQSFSFV